jgi:hypothetical protein
VPLLPRYHQRVIHSFNDDYLEQVEARIAPKLAQGADAVRGELEKIASELFMNAFEF